MKILILKSNFAFLCRILFMAGLILMACLGKSWGQVYADTSSNAITGLSTVGSPNAATNNTSLTDFTTLNSVVLGSAYLQMKFTGSTIPANTIVFVKYTTALANLLGSLTITAYSGSTANNTSLGDGTAVTTSYYATTAIDGSNYLAITSTQSFNSVRIRLGGLLGSMSIYYGFYYPLGSGCITPTTTTTSLSGINVGSIQNPNLAIDGNYSTYSNFNAVLSAGTMTQSFYYNNTASSTQNATIALSVPSSALLNLSLLSSINVQAYNGNTAVGSSVALSSILTLGLLNLTGSDSPFNVSIAPGGTFNRIDIVNGGGVNLLSGVRIYEVTLTPNKPQFTLPVDDTVIVCRGSSATLTADNPGTGNELRWYATILATDTVVLGKGSYTPPFPINTDTVFYVATGQTGCIPSSQRVPVRVLTKPIPVKPLAPNIAICSGTSTTLSVTSPIVGNTYTWYKVATGGTAFNTGTSYTTSVLTTDTTIYLQSDSTNGCSSKRDTVIISVKPLPVKPLAPNVAICNGTSTTLSVTSPIVGNTYTWYKVATGGTAFNTGTGYTTSVLAADTTIYLQSDSTNGCSSKRDTVIISVKPLPVKPLAPNVAICSGTSATLSVTSPIVGNTYTWYKVATGGTAFNTGTSYTTSVLTTDTTIYLQSDSTNGCSSKRDTVIISVKPLPAKPLAPNVAICSGTSTTLSVTSPIAGNTYTWYKVATGGTAFNTGTSYTTSVLASDTTIYLQSDSTNGCSSKRDTVIISVKPLPVKPLAPNVAICSGTSTTLSVTSPIVGNTYTWYKVATGGTAFNTGTSYTTSVLASDTTIYLQSDSTNGCSSKRDTVIISVKPLPVKPLAPNVAICSGTSTTLSVTSPIVGNTYTWYKVATGGTAFNTGTSYTTSVLTTDTTIYLQSDSTNSCSSKRDTVIISVKPLPVKPLAPNVAICSGTSTTLSVTSPIVGNTYTWYKVATGGTAFNTGTSYTTSVLTADTTIYLQSDSTNGCSSKRDTVIISVKPLPVKPLAPNVAICSGTSTTLSVTSPIVGNTYTWYKVATGGTAFNTGTSYTTSLLTADTTIYLQSDSTNSCSSKRDTVIISVKPLPVKPLAPNVAICSGTSTTLSVTSPIVGNTYTWYKVATGGIAFNTGTSYTTSLLTTDTTIYLQSDSTNGCSSKRDTVIISVKPLPVKPLAPNVAICSGTSTTLSVTSPIVGNTYTWYKVATGGTAFNTGTSYTTSVLTTDTTIYLQSDSTNSCSSKRDTVIISVKPLPVKPLTPNVAICSGTSTTLAVTSPIVGNTYTWYKVATGGTAFNTGTSYTTSVLTTDTTIYLQSDSTNSCSSKRDTVIISVKPLPVKPLAPNVAICSGTSTTLSVTSPIVGNTYTWYKVATGGTAFNTGTSYTTSVLTTDTTIYLQSDSTNSCSSKRDTVIISVKPLPVKPLTPNVAICSGTSTTLSVTSPIVGNTYTWYKVATGGTAFNTGTSYTTSALTADTTIYLQSDSTNGCSSKRDTVIISVKPVPVKPTVANTSICSGTSTTLVITNSIVGNTYNWYKIAAGGTSVHTGTSYTTSVLTADTTIYVQSDSTNGCATNSRDTVIVTVKPLPAKPSALDSIICRGTSIVLAVVNPIGGNTYNWFPTSTGGSTIHTGTTYTTSVLAADTTIYLQADSTNGCSSKRDTVIVTTNPIPAIQFVTPINVCDGITITSITYTNPQNTPTYYHFAWSAGAISAGFSNDTTDISIINPIPILIPNTANPASYSGNLIIKNAINGHQCPHTYPFTLNLVALPAALTITSFE